MPRIPFLDHELSGRSSYPRVLSILMLCLCLPGTMPRPSMAQTYSVPIRWGVIGDDANGNGVFDPGEAGGAPAFTNPGFVGEPNTDNVLWRRHERASDNIYIPYAQVTFRSALYNIVEDPTLRFPIIPDPDPNPTGDPFWEYGDILDPRASGSEWNAAHNECVRAWREDHGVEDIGVVVINARRMMTLAGDSEPGIATLDGRRVLLRDNAYVLPGSPLLAFDVVDHVDKHFAHEMGHALGGLRHTNDTTNVMSNRRLDANGDGRVDNIQLSSSVLDETGATVNQIAIVRQAARLTSGCKIAGTNTDCTSFSDVRTDRHSDAPLPELDLSMLIATNSGPWVKFVHDLMGPIDVQRTLRNYQSIHYYTLIDTDQDASTGGNPLALGIPTKFVGTEFVTGVTVKLDSRGELPAVEAKVWEFIAGSFVELKHEGIIGRVEPIIAVSERGQTHLTDQVTISFPTRLASIPAAFRAHALVVAEAVKGDPFIDILDDAREPGERGRSFRWRSPIFPTCSVSPEIARRGQPITIKVEGLLPDKPIHVVLGDKQIAKGVTKADGTGTVVADIPLNVRDGAHLLTIGTDGTALTADCIITIRG
jgi:hypothetical protein